MDKLISLQAAIDVTWEEPTYTDPINVLTEVRDKIKALPSAQPNLDRAKISDLLEKIYSIQSVHLSVEGVLARKYFCEELWKEILGSEAELPAWMKR